MSPTTSPSFSPTAMPSGQSSPPSSAPSVSPSAMPTSVPSQNPTQSPSVPPSNAPSSAPTIPPSSSPSTPPTAQPTLPTDYPSNSPSIAPTNSPTSQPLHVPTNAPYSSPSTSPSIAPSKTPSAAPSMSPTLSPTDPTSAPSTSPSSVPSWSPSVEPTDNPSNAPSGVPSQAPTVSPTDPTRTPSNAPVHSPSSAPTGAPHDSPTVIPSNSPSMTPSSAPINAPSTSPTISPTEEPTPPSNSPTTGPSSAPSHNPTVSPTLPSNSPTTAPSINPSTSPTKQPQHVPTGAPTQSPTNAPTAPTAAPSNAPSIVPSQVPTAGPTLPSRAPSASPSTVPSNTPSGAPTNAPSQSPTGYPSMTPSIVPSTSPTTAPSNIPSMIPTIAPSVAPSLAPSSSPTAIPTLPSATPSQPPSIAPSQVPSSSPTLPSASPSTVPSTTPSSAPTRQPQHVPTSAPTQIPTDYPSQPPSTAPSISPSIAPTSNPTYPSVPPTSAPSIMPSSVPSIAPSVSPTRTPSESPSLAPSVSPSQIPSSAPSVIPSNTPTDSPVAPPTGSPSTIPSQSPTTVPSQSPSGRPSTVPTQHPTNSPSAAPSFVPSQAPTSEPTPPTPAPTNMPTRTPNLDPTPNPSEAPTLSPSDPTKSPSYVPSMSPSSSPTEQPSMAPSNVPTDTPTDTPSSQPTATPSENPSLAPTDLPTSQPSMAPTNTPTDIPTGTPSLPPTRTPSQTPSLTPTDQPTEQPSMTPTDEPSKQPSNEPSTEPTKSPSLIPTSMPTPLPTKSPSLEPTLIPTVPTESPSRIPSIIPTRVPSPAPTARPTNKTNTDNTKQYYVKIELKNSTLSADALTNNDDEAQETFKDAVSNAVTASAQLSDDFVDSEFFKIKGECVDANNADCESTSRRRLQIKGESRLARIVRKLQSNPPESYSVELYLYFKENSDDAVIENWLTDDFEEELKEELDAQFDGSASFGEISVSDVTQITVADDSFFNAESIATWSQWTIMIIAVFTLLLCFIGKIHTWITHTSVFHITYVLMFGFYAYDFFSDFFFTLLLFVEQDNDEINAESFVPFVYLFFASAGLMTCTTIMNSVTLLRATNQWQTDREIADRVKPWLQHYFAVLLVLSVMSGSCFGAIELVNCNLLGITIFSMGLSWKHMQQFQIKRLYNTVMIENIPQLTIQLIATTNSPPNSAGSVVTYLAIISSIISIFVAILTFFVEKRAIKDHDSLTKFTIVVISPQIVLNFKKFKRDTFYLKKAVAQVFPLDPHAVEILQPLRCTGGMSFGAVISTIQKDKYELFSDLTRSVDTHELGNSIKQFWNISEACLVKSVKLHLGDDLKDFDMYYAKEYKDESEYLAQAHEYGSPDSMPARVGTLHRSRTIERVRTQTLQSQSGQRELQFDTFGREGARSRSGTGQTRPRGGNHLRQGSLNSVKSRSQSEVSQHHTNGAPPGSISRHTSISNVVNGIHATNVQAINAIGGSNGTPMAYGTPHRMPMNGYPTDLGAQTPSTVGNGIGNGNGIINGIGVSHHGSASTDKRVRYKMNVPAIELTGSTQNSTKQDSYALNQQLKASQQLSVIPGPSSQQVSDRSAQASLSANIPTVNQHHPHGTYGQSMDSIYTDASYDEKDRDITIIDEITSGHNTHKGTSKDIQIVGTPVASHGTNGENVNYAELKDGRARKGRQESGTVTGDSASRSQTALSHLAHTMTPSRIQAAVISEMAKRMEKRIYAEKVTTNYKSKHKKKKHKSSKRRHKHHNSGKRSNVAGLDDKVLSHSANEDDDDMYKRKRRRGDSKQRKRVKSKSRKHRHKNKKRRGGGGGGGGGRTSDRHDRRKKSRRGKSKRRKKSRKDKIAEPAEGTGYLPEEDDEIAPPDPNPHVSTLSDENTSQSNDDFKDGDDSISGSYSDSRTDSESESSYSTSGSESYSSETSDESESEESEDDHDKHKRNRSRKHQKHATLDQQKSEEADSTPVTSSGVKSFAE